MRAVADEASRVWARPEIEARGDLEQTTAALATALEHRFGSGPVVGRMAALVVSAESPSG
jgi:hypothetical protein